MLRIVARLMVILAAGFPAGCASISLPDIGSAPYVVILGNAQDGGYPQARCNRPHCERGWEDPDERRFVSSIAVVDPESGERWLFDATPDFPHQLRMLDEIAPSDVILDGIFLTHAHIGHYTGLMHLGREVMGTSRIPVWAMPRMADFLRTSGPWSQLVSLGNIEIEPLRSGEWVELNHRLRARPFLVPHRDELSETVGYVIEGPAGSVAFIPDIDKWERWDEPIERLIESVDVALLDGTFFADGEIPRDISEIPHPFISESIERFRDLPPELRERVWFIHLNHSNPALDPRSEARRRVIDAGHRVAAQGDIIFLGSE